MSHVSSQSLSEFRLKADETLDRINRTGEAELLTVDGEARAVLLSPQAFEALAREIELSRDVCSIRKSIAQINDGKFRDVDDALNSIRSELLDMKRKQSA